MNTLAQNEPSTNTAATTAASSDGVQDAMVMGSQFVPTWLAMVLSFLLGALAMRALQEVAKRNKFKYAKRCFHCLGSGEEPEKGALVMCSDCAGTGQVEDENEPATECKNCKGEGVEPCEECEGEGKVEGSVCAACEGSGEKKDDDGEAIECAFCKGEGEVAATIKKTVSCETCDGTGKIKRD